MLVRKLFIVYDLYRCRGVRKAVGYLLMCKCTVKLEDEPFITVDPCRWKKLNPTTPVWFQQFLINSFTCINKCTCILISANQGQRHSYFPSTSNVACANGVMQVVQLFIVFPAQILYWNSTVNQSVLFPFLSLELKGQQFFVCL